MKKVVIVGSAGSPIDAIELLKNHSRRSYAAIVCIHFTASAMEAFAHHIKRETRSDVVIVRSPVAVEHRIYLPDGGKDLVFLDEKTLTVTTSEFKTHPSIASLFRSMVRIANHDFIVVVLGGLGDDGKDYVHDLHTRGVRFIFQKNARFLYLPRNLSEAIDRQGEFMELNSIKSLLETL